MEIKVGQVWQNDKDEKFYIKEVRDKDSINSRVTFVSLQNTDEYFAGEVGSCSYECFMYQTKNLILWQENFVIDEKLQCIMKLENIDYDIEKYKSKIKELNNLIINLEANRLDTLEKLNELDKVGK